MQRQVHGILLNSLTYTLPVMGCCSLRMTQHAWGQVSSDELEASLHLDGELDARFLMLCTPQLQQAHRALQARAHLCLPLN